MDDNSEVVSDEEEETEYEKNFPECYKYLLEEDKKEPKRYKEFIKEQIKGKIFDRIFWDN
jgi:hypothetical protein